MYNHLFHFKDKRLLIDMTIVQAIIEEESNHTFIVTCNDRYSVNESFDEVNKAWKEAMEFEARTKEENFSITDNWDYSTSEDLITRLGRAAIETRINPGEDITNLTDEELLNKLFPLNHNSE